MALLASTSALIVDLRRNGGGSPSGAALLCSYLVDAEPIHLNSFSWRKGDRTYQWWTLPYVPGRRYLDRPVYVLTNGQTFEARHEPAPIAGRAGRVRGSCVAAWCVAPGRSAVVLAGQAPQQVAARGRLRTTFQVRRRRAGRRRHTPCVPNRRASPPG